MKLQVVVTVSLITSAVALSFWTSSFVQATSLSKESGDSSEKECPAILDRQHPVRATISKHDDTSEHPGIALDLLLRNISTESWWFWIEGELLQPMEHSSNLPPVNSYGSAFEVHPIAGMHRGRLLRFYRDHGPVLLLLPPCGTVTLKRITVHYDRDLAEVDPEMGLSVFVARDWTWKLRKELDEASALNPLVVDGEEGSEVLFRSGMLHGLAPVDLVVPQHLTVRIPLVVPRSPPLTTLVESATYRITHSIRMQIVAVSEDGDGPFACMRTSDRFSDFQKMNKYRVGDLFKYGFRGWKISAIEPRKEGDGGVVRVEEIAGIYQEWRKRKNEERGK